MWEPLTKTFKEIIDRNHSTLFFTNSRRLAERITLKINDATPQPLAYAHHGSLSREIRTEVESRLKSGELRAIVATNSLEMGIDIGSLDEVVLIQSPPSIASALQRVGRAGHRVGDVSRGTLFPTHAQDFVEAAALADGIAARDLEPLACIDNPLDVLAQIIVSMSANQMWAVDDVYAVLRQSHSYRSLTREHFELVVEMLAGRYCGIATARSQTARSCSTASNARCTRQKARCMRSTTPAARFRIAATTICGTPTRTR